MKYCNIIFGLLLFTAISYSIYDQSVGEKGFLYYLHDLPHSFVVLMILLMNLPESKVKS